MKIELTKTMSSPRLGPITKFLARISMEIYKFLYLIELEGQIFWDFSCKNKT